MRKFIITIEGKSYEVGVEEVGAAQTQQTMAAPAAAAPAAPAADTAAASGEKVLSPFPGLIKKFLVK